LRTQQVAIVWFLNATTIGWSQIRWENKHEIIVNMLNITNNTLQKVKI
jgi:hypothetical protein